MRESVIQHIFKESKRAQGQNFIKEKQQKVHDIGYNKSTAKKKMKATKQKGNYKEGTQRGSVVQEQPKRTTKCSYKDSRSVRHPSWVKKLSKEFNNHKNDKKNQKQYS